MTYRGLRYTKTDKSFLLKANNIKMLCAVSANRPTLCRTCVALCDLKINKNNETLGDREHNSLTMLCLSFVYYRRPTSLPSTYNRDHKGSGHLFIDTRSLPCASRPTLSL